MGYCTININVNGQPSFCVTEQPRQRVYGGGCNTININVINRYSYACTDIIKYKMY